MRLKYLLCLLLLTAISLPSSAMNEDSADKTASDATAAGVASDDTALTTAAKPIVVLEKSPRFTVRLAANATTGFQWFLFSYDHDLVRPIRSQYQAGNGRLMGAPGVSVWEFELKHAAFDVPQVTHLVFEYRRPWEPRFGNRQAVIVISQPRSVSK